MYPDVLDASTDTVPLYFIPSTSKIRIDGLMIMLLIPQEATVTLSSRRVISANLNALPHMIEDLNLNELSKMAPASSNIKSLEPETFFTFTQDHMLQVIGVIILMVFVSLIASYISLRKTINKNI